MFKTKILGLKFFVKVLPEMMPVFRHLVTKMMSKLKLEDMGDAGAEAMAWVDNFKKALHRLCGVKLTLLLCGPDCRPYEELEKQQGVAGSC